MGRFTNIEPQIKAAELENTVADQHQKAEARQSRDKLAKDPKFYIKRNMRGVNQIEKQRQALQSQIDRERRIQSAKEGVTRGVLPAYLVRRKKEAEEERVRTLQEIELNKRPQGTQRLRQEEIEDVRTNLHREKEHLQDMITRSSVSLYTTRAQRENRAIVDKMDAVDRALTVFERQRVYVKK